MNYIEEYYNKIASGEIVACKRIKQVYEMLIDKLHNPEKYYPWVFDEELGNRPIEFIETFCKQAQGELGGALKLELFQKAKHQAVFGFVHKDTRFRQYQEVLDIRGRKNGKALALDTDIPTPNGWVKMKDLKVGDYVFGDNGKPTKIILVSDIFINHKCYKIEFEDGEKIISDSEHIWKVKTKKRGIINLTTEELSKSFKRIRKDGKGVEYKFRVPMNAEIEYKEKELIIPPYLLGIWLGDGSSGDTRVTCSDEDIEEITDIISCYNYKIKRYYNKNRANSFSLGVKGKGIQNEFLNGLRQLKVLNNKHIPKEYLHGSIDQRKELLKGLMDTDGYCSKSGQCEFSQKDYNVIIQFSELLSSLGIKHSIREKQISINGKICIAYSVLFYVDKNKSCFKLRRKHERLKEQLNHRMMYKSIVNIEECMSVPTKCIKVDNETSLYLAGKRMTVTHNTTELAADETYMLVGDGEGSPECYIIATKLDQSKKGFNECYKMIQQSPDLNKHLKKRKSDIYCPFNYGSLQALASNSNGLDGLNAHMVTIDELAAIKNRDIYDLMKQSMSSRRQPLLDCITTNGFIRGSIFDSQYDYACGVLDGKIKDDRFIAFIYELDDKEEWDKEEMWIKANPGLGPIKKVEFLRDCVNKAKSDPAFKATVMVKDFNMKENSASAWLRWDELNNEAIFSLKEMGFRYGIGCFDLAETTDLASAKVLCMRRDDPKIYVIQMYFVPEEKLNQEETNKEDDNVPYKLWEQQGLIRVCPGNKVNKYDMLEWFKELRDLYDIYIPWIGYDPWHVDDSLLQAYEDEFGKDAMIPVRQGAYTLSFPMKELKADLIADRIIYNNNPIDKWCLSNMEIKTDINNNIQPIKGTDNRKRIDGGVSLIIGYVVLLDKMSEYENMV